MASYTHASRFLLLFKLQTHTYGTAVIVSSSHQSTEQCWKRDQAMSSDEDDVIERLSHSLALSSILLARITMGVDANSRNRSAKRMKTEHDPSGERRESRDMDWKDIMASGPLGERFRAAMELRKDGSGASVSVAESIEDVILTPILKSTLRESVSLQSEQLADKAWQDFMMGETGGPVGRLLGRERKEELLRKLRVQHRDEP